MLPIKYMVSDSHSNISYNLFHCWPANKFCKPNHKTLIKNCYFLIISKIIFVTLTIFFFSSCGGDSSPSGGEVEDPTPVPVPVIPAASGGLSEKNWNSAIALENNSGNAYYPSVAINSSGIAVVIWSQTNGKRGELHARLIDVINNNASEDQVIDNGVVDVEKTSINSTNSKSVSIDDEGNVVALFSASNDGENNDIFITQYNSINDSWSMVTLFEDQLEESMFPVVKLNKSGNGVGTFISGDQLWARTFNEGVWSEEIQVSVSAITMVRSPRSFNDASFYDLAVDEKGGVYIVWSDEGRIHYREYSGLSSWSEAVPISEEDNPAYHPVIASGENKRLVTAWLMSDGNDISVYGSVYLNEHWNTPVLLEFLPVNMISPDIIIDSDGIAHIVFVEGISSFRVTTPPHQ